MTNVRVQPSSETLQILKKYQMVFRTDTGVFTVLYPEDATKPKLREAIADAMGDAGMVFSMNAELPDFYNVTNLPLTFRGPLIFSSSDIAMKDDTAVFVTQTPEEPSSTVAATGAITIRKNELFNSDYTLNITNYAVALEARKTHWNYYIIDRSGIGLENTRVTNGKGIDFEAPVVQKLPNNQEAMLYSSGTYEFAFSERPEHRFDLVQMTDEMSSNSKTIFKGLPVAAGTQILTSEQDGQSYIYSAIYVYV